MWRESELEDDLHILTWTLLSVNYNPSPGSKRSSTLLRDKTIQSYASPSSRRRRGSRATIESSDSDVRNRYPSNPAPVSRVEIEDASESIRPTVGGLGGGDGGGEGCPEGPGEWTSTGSFRGLSESGSEFGHGLGRSSGLEGGGVFDTGGETVGATVELATSEGDSAVGGDGGKF